MKGKEKKVTKEILKSRKSNIIEVVSRFKYLTVPHIMKLLDHSVGKRTFYQDLTDLESLDVIDFWQWDWKTRVVTMPDVMTFSSIHDPLVSATVLSILDNPYDYRIWLDHTDGYEHERIESYSKIYKTFPDAFLYSKNLKISVEIELNFKESGRIKNRLHGYSAPGELTHILYYFSRKSVMNNFLNRVKEFQEDVDIPIVEKNRLVDRLRVLCMSEEDFFESCINSKIKLDSFKPLDELLFSPKMHNGEDNVL